MKRGIHCQWSTYHSPYYQALSESCGHPVLSWLLLQFSSLFHVKSSLPFQRKKSVIPKVLCRTDWFWVKLAIRYFHIDYNASCLPPKILHNYFFQYLLGITVVPREIEDSGYVKCFFFFFWGGGGLTRCFMVYVKMVNGCPAYNFTW